MCGLVPAPSALWNWHLDHAEAFYAEEVVRVARVDRQVVRYRDRGNHGVIATCARLAAHTTERRGNSTECACGSRVEGKWIEVCLRLLELGLTRDTFGLVFGYERSDRELSQCHRCDQGLTWKIRRVGEPAQKNHRRGVQDASGRLWGLLLWTFLEAHKLVSSSSSMSARNATGSTGASRLQRLTSAAAERVLDGSARNSATALPERVMVICSPCAARSTMSPPWLRRSRMLTSDMPRVYHA